MLIGVLSICIHGGLLFCNEYFSLMWDTSHPHILKNITCTMTRVLRALIKPLNLFQSQSPVVERPNALVERPNERLKRWTHEIPATCSCEARPWTD